MNHFYFGVLLILLGDALLSVVLRAHGHAGWIVVLILAEGAVLCAGLSFLAAQGSSRADQEAKRRLGWATMGLAVLAICVGVWI